MKNWVKRTPGRRKEDLEGFASYCLDCNLRGEVDSKLGLKIFAVFVSSLIALIAIAGSLGGLGLSRILDNQKFTLEAVHSIGERTAKIEARQEIIMRKVIDLDSAVTDK